MFTPSEEPDRREQIVGQVAFNRNHRHAVLLLENLRLAVEFAPDIVRTIFLDCFGLRGTNPELEAIERRIAALQQAVQALCDQIEPVRHQVKELVEWSENSYAEQDQITQRMRKIEERLDAAAKFGATLKGQVTRSAKKEATGYDVEV